MLPTRSSRVFAQPIESQRGSLRYSQTVFSLAFSDLLSGNAPTEGTSIIREQLRDARLPPGIAPFLQRSLDDYEQHKGEYDSFSERLAKLEAYDRVLFKLNLWMSVVGMIGLSLSIALLFVIWVPGVGSIYDAQVFQNHASRYESAQLLKIANVASTGVLIALLIVYYFFSGKSRQIQHRFPTTSRAFLSGSFKFQFLAEFLLCVIGPLPYCENVWTDKIAMFQWARFYLCFRAFRDHMLLYKHRWRMSEQHKSSFGLVRTKEVTLLCVRVIFDRYLVPFAVFLAFFVILNFSVFIYVLERESMDELFQNYEDVIWFAAVTATTVGYGDRVPSVSGARFVTMLCAATGIVITSLLSGAVANKLTPSDQHKLAALKTSQKAKEKALRSTSRKLFVVWMYYHLKMRKLRRLQSCISSESPSSIMRLLGISLKDIPSHFLCPSTRTLMMNPVMTPDGLVVDASALQEDQKARAISQIHLKTAINGWLSDIRRDKVSKLRQDLDHWYQRFSFLKNKYYTINSQIQQIYSALQCNDDRMPLTTSLHPLGFLSRTAFDASPSPSTSMSGRIASSGGDEYEFEPGEGDPEVDLPSAVPGRYPLPSVLAPPPSILGPVPKNVSVSKRVSFSDSVNAEDAVAKLNFCERSAANELSPLISQLSEIQNKLMENCAEKQKKENQKREKLSKLILMLESNMNEAPLTEREKLVLGVLKDL